MNASPVSSLLIAAIADIADAFGASEPVIALDAAGRTLRFLNAAAARHFDITDVSAAMGRSVPFEEPIERHLARVLPGLAAGASTTERIRFYRGIKPVVETVRLKRVTTADGTDVIIITLAGLAVAGDIGIEATLDLYAAPDQLITLFGEDDILAVVGDHEVLDGAHDEIEAMAECVEGKGVERRRVRVEGGSREVTVVRSAGSTNVRRLLHVGPLQAVAADEPAGDEISTGFRFDQAGRPRRFAWQIDAGGTVVGFGPELAAALGLHVAPEAGEDWAAFSDRLCLDPEATFARAVAKRSAWQGLTLDWPIEGTALRAEVELAGMPIREAVSGFAGYRGFGIVKPSTAKPDALLTGLIVAKAHAPDPAAADDEPALDAEELAIADAVQEEAAAKAAEAQPDPTVIAAATVEEAMAAEAAMLHEPESPTSISMPEPEPGVEAADAPIAEATAEADVLETNEIGASERAETAEPVLPKDQSRQVPDVWASAPALGSRPVPVPAFEPAALEVAVLHPASRPVADISPETLRLSNAERNAFRQIAQALGARFEGDEDEEPEAAALTPQPFETSRSVAPQPPRPSVAALLAELHPSARPAGTDLVDRLPVAVAVISGDTFAYANDAFLKLTGYQTLADLNERGGLDALFAGPHVGKDWSVDPAKRPVPLITSSGEVVPAEVLIAQTPWGAGTALAMTIQRIERSPEATLDGTARAAIEALAGARIRLRELEAIVEAATDGVLLVEFDGRIASVNGAAEELFGMTRAEMEGTPVSALVAPESRRSLADLIEAATRGDLPGKGREINGLSRHQGRIPLVFAIGRTTAELGDQPRLCAVIRDIRDWKRSEEELTAAKRRAEESSLQKTDFLAKISHEIRTPLNAIIGFSEVMLGERFGAIGAERYKDYLRDIQSSGTHIMSLVNDLLDLSKVEAGKMEMKFEPVQLGDILADCVQLMQPQANRERIIIRSSLPQGLPPVAADQRSIKQIMLNLISNAIKFTPAGGQVIVSAVREETGEVVIRVRDTGYGMSESEIQLALEPFRQLHTDRGRGGGTGLGLPLTKALVEANRAAMRIDSAVNQGTLVQVIFPIARVLPAA